VKTYGKTSRHPKFISYKEHSLKPLLLIVEIVAEVFLKVLPNLVTLETSAKTSATMCFPCSGWGGYCAPLLPPQGVVFWEGHIDSFIITKAIRLFKVNKKTLLACWLEPFG